jgi:hypothetical protein
MRSTRRRRVSNLGSVGFLPFELEAIRARIRKMSDDELLKYGKAAKSMCEPDANFGRPPSDVYVTQLREAREEWRRRHPKPPEDDNAKANLPQS